MALVTKICTREFCLISNKKGESSRGDVWTSAVGEGIQKIGG
jgi:hypothetical protein